MKKIFILLVLTLCCATMLYAAGGQTPVPGTNLPAMSDGPHGYSNGNYLKSTASGWVWAAGGGGGGITPGQSATFNNVTALGAYYGDGSHLVGVSARPNSYTNVSSLSANALPKSGGTLSGNVDFSGKMAVNMAGDNGPVLPASPTMNQSFMHMPTGRMVAMTWNGTSWTAETSYGSMTLYVDTTNGIDTQNGGFGTGTDAFKTIQFAVNQIPGNVGGDVYINVATGSYTESVTVQGKYPSGAFNIYIIGTWTILKSATSVSSATDRTTATATASLVASGGGMTTNAYQNKMLYIVSGTGSGQYRSILSNTATTIYIETWNTKPDATSQFVIYDWASIIEGGSARANGILVNPGQMNVRVSNLLFQNLTNYGVNIATANNCGIANCAFLNNAQGGVVITNCQAVSGASIDSSYFSGGLYGVRANAGAFIATIVNCYFNAQTMYGVYGAAYCYVGVQRCRFNAIGVAGVYSESTGCFVPFSTTGAAGVSVSSFVSSPYGIKFSNGSRGSYLNLQLFSGCTTNTLIGSFNQVAGTATLSGGTVTVANKGIAATDIIIFNRIGNFATIGDITPTISAGVSFTLTSTSGSDTGIFNYQIISP